MEWCSDRSRCVQGQGAKYADMNVEKKLYSSHWNGEGKNCQARTRELPAQRDTADIVALKLDEKLDQVLLKLDAVGVNTAHIQVDVERKFSRMSNRLDALAAASNSRLDQIRNLLQSSSSASLHDQCRAAAAADFLVGSFEVQLQDALQEKASLERDFRDLSFAHFDQTDKVCRRDRPH